VDGEAVWAGTDGRSDFDTLHSHAHDTQVFLYGFDLLELNGENYRQHPLEQRKAKLEKILARPRRASVLAQSITQCNALRP
jgi:ATP-dependent DNA ligase